jgi:hypothetical protein
MLVGFALTPAELIDLLSVSISDLARTQVEHERRVEPAPDSFDARNGISVVFAGRIVERPNAMAITVASVDGRYFDVYGERSLLDNVCADLHDGVTDVEVIELATEPGSYRVRRAQTEEKAA